MYSAKNGVFWLGDDIFFAGQSYGFETQLQTLQKDRNNLEYDVYVYKFRFGADWWDDCLQINEVGTQVMERRMTYTSGFDVELDGLYTFSTT